MLASAIVNAAIGAAFGLAVNASSEFLPGWLGHARGAYTALLVTTVLTAVVIGREQQSAG